jgi:hypothetical protein
LKKHSHGKYVYGIVAPYDRLEGGGWHNSKYADSMQNDNPVNLGRVGINNEHVSVVFFRDMGVMVSQMALQQAQTIRAAIAAGKGNSISYIISHQRAVEAARNAGMVVLPIRFGSVVTEENLRRLATQKQQEYMLKLYKFRDKEEYGVKLLFGNSTERMLAARVERHPEVARIKADAKAKMSNNEERGFFAKLRLDDIRKTQKLQMIDGIVKTVHDKLMGVAEMANSLTLGTADTISNRAYLVDRSREDEFLSLIESIKHSIRSEIDLILHFSGPWAPYSFCMDNIDSYQFAETPGQFQKKIGRAA